jgi:hypothetical protein
MLYEHESAKLVLGTLAGSTTTPQPRVGTRYGRAPVAPDPPIPRKPRAGATLDGIPARADKLGLIAEAGYCQNQNVMKTVTAKVQNANAPGLKMAARSSEFGCDTPQKSQRMAPDHTVAEQFLQERFAFRIAEMETNKSSR